MKSGSKPLGFTITEVMIFLAVSGAVLVSAMGLITNSQNNSRFTQAVNDLQQQIDLTANNVANGYYPASTSKKCAPDTLAGKLNFTDDASERGTNDKCIFIGRVMLFNEGSENLKVFTTAGARLTDEGTEVSDISQAKATIYPQNQEVQLKYGISVCKIESIDSVGSSTEVQAIGFFTGFGQQDTVNGGLVSGALKSNFAGIASVADDSALRSKIENPDFRNSFESIKNPAGGIKLTVKSGTTNQYAIIQLGGESKTASTTIKIVNGATSC